MSLIKKCDVKTHFATRRRKGTSPIRVAGTPIMAEAPEIDRVSAEVNQAVFVEDFSLEHCSPGANATAEVIVNTGRSNLVPVVPVTPES